MRFRLVQGCVGGAVLILVQLAGSVAAWAAAGGEGPGGGDPGDEGGAKIGLVLSGGGARGAAHVGVLQVLEELEIPVDAVAGTSMGAVVGGLWAAGLGADEIARSLEQVDWAEALRDLPPRQFLSFRRKEDERGVRGKARLGVGRRGLAVPLGVLRGEELTFLLRTLLLPHRPARDFDQLRVPFRAVAADLVTGDAVALGEGDLVTAIRASMSIPGVFQPVELDGRLLVDGGIAANLPVAVARQMGAELLIVVDITSKPATREELGSLFAVTDQILDLLMLDNVEEQLELLRPDDVLLTPALDDFEASSFDRADAIVAAGAAAARGAAKRLRGLAGERRARQPPATEIAAAPVRLHDVRVSSTSELVERAVTSRVRSRPGDELDLERLHRDLRRLYGLGVFESVDFSLDDAPEGAVLEIRAQERSGGDDALRFGMELQDNLDGETSFSLRLRHTELLLNRRGGEWRADLAVGEEQLLRIELYQPLDIGGLFVAPRVEARRESRRLAGEAEAPVRLEGWGAGVDLGVAFDNCCEVRWGIERRERDLRDRSPQGGRGELDTTRWRLRFAADTLDSIDFPSRGVVTTVELEHAATGLGSDFERSLAAASFLTARPLGSWRAAFGIEMGTDLDDTDLDVAVGPAPFRLGGFLRLSGHRRDALAGRHLAFGRVVLYRQLSGAGLFGLPLFAGGSLEAGNAWLDRDAVDLEELELAGSLFFGADSPLGPIYLGAGFGESGRRELTFLLGFTRLGELLRERP